MSRARRVGSGMVALALAAALVIALVGAYRRGDLNSLICNGACPARYTTVPAAVASVAAGSDTAATAGTGPVDGSALAAELRSRLSAKELGTAGFVALDGRTGRQLTASHDVAMLPASTTKLVTAFSALTAVGPLHRFTTRVVRSGSALTLVGGGDPYLVAKRAGRSVDRATLVDLADRTAKEVGRGTFALRYDASLFTGPATSSSWPSTYVSTEVVSPVSALWLAPTSTGTEMTTDAAGTAAKFAALLKARGVRVTSVSAGRAAPGAESVAVVRSATLAQLVVDMLRTSDNDTAEVLLRQTAIAAGEPASFAGGVAAVRAILTKAGIDTTQMTLVDGSGLSRRDRLRPATLAEVIWESTRSARTAAVADGLPVAGFSGTMLKRLSREPAQLGLVRAKTGTLTGVHDLAGIATLSGGRPVVFAVMANVSDTTSATATIAALDGVVASIAGCACGAGK